MLSMPGKSLKVHITPLYFFFNFLPTYSSSVVCTHLNWLYIQNERFYGGNYRAISFFQMVITSLGLEIRKKMLITSYSMSHLSLSLKIFCNYNGIIFKKIREVFSIYLCKAGSLQNVSPSKRKHDQVKQTRGYFYHAN